MNIIFLDVDGVLNSVRNLIDMYNKTHKPFFGYYYPFDLECLNNLKRLVSVTNSKIVITSTWRMDQEGIDILLSTLKEYDLDKEVIGYTPILHTTRGNEIKSFLSSLNYKPNFIIIDDRSDMDDLLPYLVITDPYIGLSDKNVEDGIKKLSKTLDSDRKAL